MNHEELLFSAATQVGINGTLFWYESTTCEDAVANSGKGNFMDPTEVTGGLYYYKYPKYSLEDKGAVHPLDLENFNMTKWTNFHPLGLGYWPETRTLYVANHDQHGSTIEVFTVNKEATAATCQRTLSGGLIQTPNSIIPISKDEIYFTNDHKYKIREQRPLAILETYLGIPGGSIVYMNLKTNQSFTVANLPFANGVALLNNTHLAVASTVKLSISIFAINKVTKTLTLKQKLHTGYYVGW